jgi:predicted nucleic acid-binding protein
LIIDTDVLIWSLRGYEKAARAISAFDSFNISSITYMELIQGMKNKDELRALEFEIASNNIQILHPTAEISQRAIVMLKELSLSHSIGLADALIAATAIQHGEILFTGNAKHFKAITGLKLKEYKP